jgi:hypothetical protein
MHRFLRISCDKHRCICVYFCAKYEKVKGRGVSERKRDNRRQVMCHYSLEGSTWTTIPPLPASWSNKFYVFMFSAKKSWMEESKVPIGEQHLFTCVFFWFYSDNYCVELSAAQMVEAPSPIKLRDNRLFTRWVRDHYTHNWNKEAWRAGVREAWPF